MNPLKPFFKEYVHNFLDLWLQINDLKWNANEDLNAFCESLSDMCKIPPPMTAYESAKKETEERNDIFELWEWLEFASEPFASDAP